MARGAAALPDILLRAERIVLQLESAAEKGMGLSVETIEKIAGIEARRVRWLGIALWVIALAVVYQNHQVRQSAARYGQSGNSSSERFSPLIL